MTGIVNKNIIAGWGARAIVLLLSFANTRLMIDCIGAEGFAAYSIVLSLTPWIALLNLGLPITIQNTISQLRGNEGDYETARSNAYGTMVAAAIAFTPIVIIIGWIFYRWFLDDYIFASATAVIGVFFLIYVSSMSQLLTQVMYAEHEAFWPNVYPVFAPIWTACILLIAKLNAFENFNLIIIFVSISNLLMPIHGAAKLKVFKIAQFSIKSSVKLVASARNQLLFSFLSTVTLSVDYLVMSRILAAVDIVNYNIVSRLFMSLLVVQGVILATNWTPISDLMHKNEMADARKKVHSVLKQGLTIGAGIGFMLLIGIAPITNLLTGGNVNQVSYGLALAYWAYIMLRIWTDTYAVALQGYGMVAAINKFIPYQAVVSVAGQYALGSLYGAIGVVFGLMASFVFTASWIIPKKFYSLTSD